MEKSVKNIVRNWDCSPTIVDGVIEENCLFENTLIEGFGRIIIDKDFIDSMNEIDEYYKKSSHQI